MLGDAAKNESESGVGGMMTAGIGLGAGLPLGQKMGQEMSVDSGESSTKTEVSVTEKLKQLKSLLDDGLISEEQYKEKQSKLLEDL